MIKKYFYVRYTICIVHARRVAPGCLSCRRLQGLGDFVFYSVLVSKAALYGFTAWAACVVVIVFGLGATLVLLAVYRMALPVRPYALPRRRRKNSVLAFGCVPSLCWWCWWCVCGLFIVLICKHDRTHGLLAVPVVVSLKRHTARSFDLSGLIKIAMKADYSVSTLYMLVGIPGVGSLLLTTTQNQSPPPSAQ